MVAMMFWRISPNSSSWRMMMGFWVDVPSRLFFSFSSKVLYWAICWPASLLVKPVCAGSSL